MKDYKQMYEDVMDRAGGERRHRADMKRKALEIGLSVLAAVILSVSGVLFFGNIIRPEHNGRTMLSLEGTEMETVPSGTPQNGTVDETKDQERIPEPGDAVGWTTENPAESGFHAMSEAGTDPHESEGTEPATEGSSADDSAGGYFYAAVMPDDAENAEDLILIRYQVVDTSVNGVVYYRVEGETVPGSVSNLVSMDIAQSMNNYYSGQLNSVAANAMAGNAVSANISSNFFVLPVELTNTSGRPISAQAFEQAVAGTAPDPAGTNLILTVVVSEGTGEE